MVDFELVKLLQQGTQAWEEWRAEHLDEHPNLTNADLHGLDLRRMCLPLARLQGANLRGANLSEAEIQHANLWGADLREAQLVGTQFDGSAFVESNLNGANLTRANLPGTTFQGAQLVRSILSGAYVEQAEFLGADLSHADLSAVMGKQAGFQAILRGAVFRNADLLQANFSGADLESADLASATLRGATFSETNLRAADLSKAILTGSLLWNADLTDATLSDTDLTAANLGRAHLAGANLRGATLHGANFVQADLTHAILTGSKVYGVSVWDADLSNTQQTGLVITPGDHTAITVDNLEVAQFVYLLLSSDRLRGVIDTITSKVVLVLGRFTKERKQVLDALRETLRERNYSPIIFDFDKPRHETTLETVILLARMACFVIADLSDAKSILQELQAIVPTSPSLPVAPLLLADQREPGMFDFFRAFPWVLPTFYYTDLSHLLMSLDEEVILRVVDKAAELRR